ncbi:MAG: [FeFe] hydrogenase, group A [Spirochaetes bacterium]|nr:[FeFe] hydrogenase, group A [Spirochaetota bacterium]MBP8991430.1 [FeFe] hydrogenase, group A [Spirochaetota bacterium]NLJ05888.1 2Fe-2S iron-sulfur cluster binding domain-containing protein [Exilispira sp.]HQJ40347.1 NADH-dependent [FeFe] hydrogenase, group A6 [Exilispira sp.]
MNSTIPVIVDGKKVEVPNGSTIIQAAEYAGIEIPRLCYYKDLTPTGNCGVCIVEVKGQKGFKRSCTTPVTPNMEIITRSAEIINARKTVVELILANHPDDCLTCIKSGDCELQALSQQLGIDREKIDKVLTKKPIDDSSLSIVREPEKCILCGRCLRACQDIQTVFAIEAMGRGFNTEITTPSGSMAESVCINCGQCISVCPTGALHEKLEIDEVWAALNNPDKVVIVQEAPAIRVSLAEEFDLPPGTNLVGKMYNALKMLGFDYVFDTNFTADLTIMEEGSEFIERLHENGPYPLITSCSPGWIKFMETFYPDLTECISTCKSPQQMFGALSKTYFAKMYNIDPAKIVTVSIMPCTAKKFEARRPEMRSSGFADVDYVLTTREFIKMVKQVGINIAAIDDAQPNDLMGSYSGAATIFGTTGGVMEAALRTAYELVTGKALDSCDIKEARGFEGVKEFTIDVEGTTLSCAVAHGLGNARKVLDKVKEAKEKGKPSPYHFIEIMACPGGCVGGGGQPYGSTLERRLERAKGLYDEDGGMKIRKSHENPEIKKIYEDFLEKPLGHKSHELLHTHYIKRDALL